MWCGFIELELSGGRWIGRLRECRLACGVRVSGVSRGNGNPLIVRRRWLSPRAVTCSTDCSIIHQANLNRDLNRRYQRERRARRRTLNANEQVLLKSSGSPFCRAYRNQQQNYPM